MISAYTLGSEPLKIDPRRVPSSFVLKAVALMVDGCGLQNVGVSVQPFALPTIPAVDGFAHRWPGVGHMLGGAVQELRSLLV